jgi:hypothetical protein
MGRVLCPTRAFADRGQAVSFVRCHFSHIPPNYVVEGVPAQRKPPEVGRVPEPCG